MGVRCRRVIQVPFLTPLEVGMTIPHKLLGNTQLSISRMGVGAWAMGGGSYAFGWGPQDDKASIAAIHGAVDAGINWIDTAPVYGLGHSEEVVASALAGLHPRPFVFTKCGFAWDAQKRIRRTLRAGSIRNELEASLKRLRTNLIDLYQIHWPDPDSELEEAWTTMADLKKDGKIRHIGICNASVAQLRRLEKIAPVESLQPPYSLITRDAEAEIFPYAIPNSLGVITYSPMKSGLLSGAMTRDRIAALPSDDFRKDTAEYQEPRLSRNLALVDFLRQIARELNSSAGELAIAWVLHNPAVTGAIVGFRSPSQVNGLLGALSLQLKMEQLQRIAEFQQKFAPGKWEILASKVKRRLKSLRNS
jgi:aryl-alcohol dehydrogenase-like predicted oxidoreductase